MSQPLRLSEEERDMLEGGAGPGVAMAMRLITGLATAMGASELLSITGAHIDSCLYHGPSGLDWVERLRRGGQSVRVPTTLNVSSLDLLHPELFRGDADTAEAARRLMDAYVSLGCEPTWTCAPYQREQRPEFGEHVAWAESNAIVFANSVLGARTHRYGDFVDSAAALTGRVPNVGLHRDDARRATRVFDVAEMAPAMFDHAVTYACLGLAIGSACGSDIPAIVGLPASTSEDQLKALGAAAASSGRVAMFHAVGLTPEAPDLITACGGSTPPVEMISAADLRSARDRVSSPSGRTGDALRTVSLGTPHYSVDEIRRLFDTLHGRSINPDVEVYVSTGREVLHEAMLRGWVRPLEEAGVTFVTDTCTYITPILHTTAGVALTDSAKWAYYAPANIGVSAQLASLSECVESAVAGRLVRDRTLWSES